MPAAECLALNSIATRPLQGRHDGSNGSVASMIYPLDMIERAVVEQAAR
jgi:hypothetical protein